MTRLEVTATIGRRPEVLQRLLLNQAMLEAFIDKQQPATKRVDVDPVAGCSNLRWTTLLEGQVPGVVSRLVGQKFDVTASLSGGTGPLSIDIRGKHEGKLRGSLELASAGADTTRITVCGDITVSIGIGAGTAARLGRDQVLKPIFVKDLFPLLSAWPDPASETERHG